MSAPWPRQAALLVLLVLSAWSAPLFTFRGFTFTGDRLVGLAAIAAVGLLARRGGLRWTPVHSALAIFAVAQVLTSALAAAQWPAGPKFASVYILGFACFALTAECAARPDGPERGARLWIGLGAALGILGGLIAFFANLWQSELWGSVRAQVLASPPGADLEIFAAKVTASEHNLYSTFLLAPFALALWRWQPETEGPAERNQFAVLGAMVVGLVFGLTRAAWIDMAALVALWVKVQRPTRRQVAALAVVTALSFAAQAAAIGESPLWFRVLQPAEEGYDWNVTARMAINRATVELWLRHPLLGNGAGSVNGLAILLPNGTVIRRPWTGNAVLFVLNDSGLLGLAAFVGLVATAGWMGRRALRLAEGATRSQIVALLAVGVALLFAYQFTHALWLMYPYVYLGLLTASMDVPDPARVTPVPR